MPLELPSFDLVVATVGRTVELSRFLDSLAAQEVPGVRVLLVDQNEDERLEPILSAAAVEIVHLRADRGLSRARNAALRRLEADVVAFPDDDCVYPLGLLRRIGQRFAESGALDGLTGRAVGFDASSSTSWRTDPARLERENLWNRAISFTIFLRRAVIETVGAFDEQLGLGSGTPWHSGEEIDYLVRAVDAGARIEYEPDLFVWHDVREDTPAIGLRDGASVGYLLRKHRYGSRVVSRMLIRPVGGTLTALAQGDTDRARYRIATARGRVRGYLGASRSKISA
ncbi:MAG TPA: glycosyltransferase family A protein [Gaiellaceae bacterium]|nr:glycosyltransferase family A protein [Gaiellaceae bacterium]